MTSLLDTDLSPDGIKVPRMVGEPADDFMYEHDTHGSMLTAK